MAAMGGRYAGGAGQHCAGTVRLEATRARLRRGPKVLLLDMPPNEAVPHILHAGHGRVRGSLHVRHVEVHNDVRELGPCNGKLRGVPN